MAQYEILMEKLSLTMEKGTIVAWHKAPGEAVKRGDQLAEVATDKVNVQIESPYVGVLQEIKVPAGETVPCLTTVAVIEGKAGQIDLSALARAGEAEAAPAAAPAAPTPAPTAAPPQGRVIASPAARKLAREQGIELAQVAGSGPQGRIVLKDVAARISAAPRLTSVAQNVAAAHGLDTSQLSGEGKIYKKQVLDAATGGKLANHPLAGQTVPLTPLQEAMAKRMSGGWNSAPQVTYCRHAEMTAASSLRQALKAQGLKVTYTDILIKACALALVDNPLLNSSFLGEAIAYHAAINIGIATDTAQGLLVPIVRDCLNKPLAQIAAESAEVINRARGGQAKLADLEGGTFTISNMGMLGIESFSPIINQPESAILGVCALQEREVIENGRKTVKPMINLCLSADHRHIDGATAARFLDRLIWLLENPYFFQLSI